MKVVLILKSKVLLQSDMLFREESIERVYPYVHYMLFSTYSEEALFVLEMTACVSAITPNRKQIIAIYIANVGSFCCMLFLSRN